MKGNWMAGIVLVLFFSLIGVSVVVAAVGGTIPYSDGVSFAVYR